MSFVASLTASPEIQTWLRLTIAHPFNEELARGALDADRFRDYLRQDSLYLVDFGRALALTAAKTERAGDAARLLSFAQGCLAAEHAMHRDYFALYGVASLGVPTPTCLLYTKFLVATAYERGPAASLAALLPCFWVYREVGDAILKRSSPSNPYRRWIETYGGTAYAATVDEAIALTDTMAALASESERAEMRAGFETSCRFEWMFWDAAYRRETWPPPLPTASGS